MSQQRLGNEFQESIFSVEDEDMDFTLDDAENDVTIALSHDELSFNSSGEDDVQSSPQNAVQDVAPSA